MLLRTPQRFLAANVRHKAKTATRKLRSMKKKLFYRPEKRRRKRTIQPTKQECGCPSLQPSLRSHTLVFFATRHTDSKIDHNKPYNFI